jgi:uncharacterized membrane protein YbhN (UPF0104 family)
MPSHRTRLLVAFAVLVAGASIVVPVAAGVPLHATGLLEAALGSALLVSCSALALNGSRPVALPARRAGQAVLATTAANAVTPAGVGGALLTMRVHRRSGLSSDEAVAAAGMRSLMGAAVATGVTALVVSRTGSAHVPGTLARVLPVLALVAITAALVVPASRRHVVGVVRAIGGLVRRPRCFAALALGCVGVTAAQLLTLHGAVTAVGGHLSWTSLLATLMGSAAARSAVPSPGGVGPIEAALVGGLSAVGLGFGTATAAVAVYRTAGHWLPVVAGVLCVRELRRHDLL